jgi:hypothetical protein
MPSDMKRNVAKKGDVAATIVLEPDVDLSSATEIVVAPCTSPKNVEQKEGSVEILEDSTSKTREEKNIQCGATCEGMVQLANLITHINVGDKYKGITSFVHPFSGAASECKQWIRQLEIFSEAHKIPQEEIKTLALYTSRESVTGFLKRRSTTNETWEVTKLEMTKRGNRRSL